MTAQRKAVQVVLSPGTENERTVTVREPEPVEYLRLMAVNIALGKFQDASSRVTEADEANVRDAMAMLSDLDEAEVVTLSKGDYARMFLGLLQVMQEDVAAPLAVVSGNGSNSSSSSTAPTKATSSRTGRKS